MKTDIVVLLMSALILAACGKNTPVPREAKPTSAQQKAAVTPAVQPARTPSNNTLSVCSDDNTPDLAAVADQISDFKARVLVDAPRTQSSARVTGEATVAAHKPRPTIDELRSRIASLGNNDAVGECCAYAFSESFRNTNRYEIIALLKELFGRELNQRQSNAVHSTIAHQYYNMTQYENALIYVDNSIGVAPNNETPLLKNFCMVKWDAYRGLLYALAKRRSDYTPEEYRGLGDALREKMNANAALWFSNQSSGREREMAIYRDLDARDWAHYEGLNEEDNDTLPHMQ